MKAVLISCAALFALSAVPATFAGSHEDGHDKPMYDCYDHAMCKGKVIGHQDPKMCKAAHGKSVMSLADHKCHELGDHADSGHH